MVERLAARLEMFFEERTDGNLRSIIAYDPASYEVYFLRDDVAEQYTEATFADSVDDSRFDSLTRALYEDSFSEEHGELTCLVQAFEHAIEMNFILEEGSGVAVGLDIDALENTHGLVADARRILLEERSS